MNNQTLVKWSVWVGTSILAFIIICNSSIDGGILLAFLANGCLAGAFFARRFPIAKIACLLSAVILFNGAIVLGMFAKLGAAAATQAVAEQYKALHQDLEDHGFVFRK